MARSKSGSAELAKALAASPQPIYVLTARRIIAFANPACAAWLGVDAASLLGARCDYHSAHLTADARTLAAGLCPPPEAFTALHTSGIVTAPAATGELRRRTAEFIAFSQAEDEPALLAIVSPADAHEPLAIGRHDPHATPAELHVLLRWLKQTLGARPVLERWLGEHPAARRVRDQFHAAASSQARVVILGPRGAGREALARGIHYRPRPEHSGPFVAVDCAVVDAESLQSSIRSLVRERGELPAPPGLLLANIEQLAFGAQHELAGFLQVPGFEVRTLATAATSLLQLAAQGQFDRALAYALSTLVIELPTLRERRADLPLLVQALIEEQNSAGGKQLSGVSPEALDLLAAYSWPGDLEQLEEVLAAAHAAATGTRLSPADLPPWLGAVEGASVRPRQSEEPIVLDDFLADIERELLRRALVRTRGNKSKAARLLGISRQRLLRRLEQLGLSPSAG
jgi:transcriptional regulator of acetoin/glycerol metabolism